MRALLVGALIVAAILFLLWTLQRSLIYFPLGEAPGPAEAGLPDAEPVAFDTTDGLRLDGWFVAAPGAGPRAAVLVFNGNAGHRGDRAPLAAALRVHGLHVLLFDYRGYGGNPGSPSEEGLAADGRAARAYLAARPDVDASRLVYFGESLGAAVATRLASEHPPAALVLRSPFTSLPDVGRVHYPILPVRPLLRDRFDVIGRIGQVGAPLLVLAGARDRIVPVEQSRRVFKAAAEPKRLLVLPRADHNDYELLAGDEMIDAIAELLRVESRTDVPRSFDGHDPAVHGRRSPTSTRRT